ncbi:MAG: hypothetical protein EU548_01910 [Promethearchaeota archaeon]|nr:MAG: hypothetical protein EU548_01910 [Candidatus Lokiarchaeota archaeon]
MAKNMNDFIVNRKDGIKICKICQSIIEDEVDHMKRRHPKYLQYIVKKEEKEERYMCCYCGLWVKNWREHVKDQHPEIIADAARRVKPEPEEEEFEFTF